MFLVGEIASCWYTDSVEKKTGMPYAIEQA